MIIDTHCHYNLEPLYSAQTPTSWQEHWQRAQQSGVVASLIVGTAVATSQLAIELAATDPRLKASIGIHPYRVAELLTETSDWNSTLHTQLAELEQLITMPEVIAVGEIGLDYYWLPKENSERQPIIDAQQQLVTAQLQLARNHQKPVILHVRDKQTPEQLTPGNAYWDMLNIVKAAGNFDQPVILHCVSGPSAYVQQAVDLGCHIGVAGNSTYPSAEQIRAIISATPVDRILLETDAPYLPPQSNRGKICQPWMISETAEYLESQLGISKASVLANTNRVFPALIP